MKYQFIPDKEIFLSKQDDLLKTKNYADVLKKIIDNNISNEVFTIGLFGGWGTGKSSIIKTVEDEIKRDKSGVKFITYDAWKYSNDSFRRMFLLKIQEELRIEQTPDMSRFYQSETAEIEPKTTLSTRGLMITLGALFLAVISLQCFEFDNTSLKISLTSVFTIIGLGITAFSGIIQKLQIQISKPQLFAPEQFEDCFKQMVDIALKPESWLKRNVKRLMSFVVKGENTVTNLDKLVIVIDNIDRCHNAMAYELLTDIKTFLSNEKYNIVFVIPVDDEALKKHLFNTTSRVADDCSKDKEEFLRKFFNIAIRIKPHQPTEMLEFVHRLNNKHSLRLNNDTLYLVSKEFAKNPRRIIQLLNNLSTELALYPQEFVEKNESLVCALLILREEFNELYKKAIVDPNNIKNYSASKKEEDADQNIFMGNVQNLFANANDADIMQILTNSDEAFPEISTVVKSGISSYNTDAIIEYIDDSNSSIIGRYIASKMMIELKHYANISAAIWTKFIVVLSRDVHFDKSVLSSFNDIFRPHYKVMIENTNQQDLLCELSLIMGNAGYTSLKSQIFAYVEKIPEDQSPLFEKWFDAFILIFKEEEDCKNLSGVSTRFYAKQAIDQENGYSDSQIKYLFNDTVVSASISKLITFEKNDDYSQALWIFENKQQLGSDIYSALFANVLSMLGDMTRKPKSEILSCVEFITPMLHAIQQECVGVELKNIYTKIFKVRTMSNPNARPIVQKKFIDEVVADKTHISKIIDFCCEVYRVSNETIAINTELQAMRLEAPININLKLVELMDKELLLNPLYDFILMDDNYDNDNSIKLTGNCFKHRKKEDNKLYLTDAQIMSKLKSLIANVTSCPNASKLILDLAQDPELKIAIVDDITNRDSDFINALPSQLLNLAVSIFSKATSSNFRTNYEFLSVIAEKGAANQKNELATLLSNNVSGRQDIDKQIMVLDKLPRLNEKKNKLIVSSLDDYLNENSVASELAESIKVIIAKFS